MDCFLRNTEIYLLISFISSRYRPIAAQWPPYPSATPLCADLSAVNP